MEQRKHSILDKNSEFPFSPSLESGETRVSRKEKENHQVDIHSVHKSEQEESQETSAPRVRIELILGSHASKTDALEVVNRLPLADGLAIELHGLTELTWKIFNAIAEGSVQKEQIREIAERLTSDPDFITPILEAVHGTHKPIFFLDKSGDSDNSARTSQNEYDALLNKIEDAIERGEYEEIVKGAKNLVDFELVVMRVRELEMQNRCERLLKDRFGKLLSEQYPGKSEYTILGFIGLTHSGVYHHLKRAHPGSISAIWQTPFIYPEQAYRKAYLGKSYGEVDLMRPIISSLVLDIVGEKCSSERTAALAANLISTSFSLEDIQLLFQKFINRKRTVNPFLLLSNVFMKSVHGHILTALLNNMLKKKGFQFHNKEDVLSLVRKKFPNYQPSDDSK